ncbi:hypothetical protein ACFQWB_16955 [Paenibacillus thermoaerophilus]|jgi:hypothetical protein|uniref:Transposase n=1 Tax=Paenibacillus thermoaerophilus TaxID=1215385 RepID=A0ABW2V659_9BACL|nr:hypothetical protein [Paenibacillus thermoaerophilus]TMV04313.1 hypothetical protein FE781_17180 [Paenibacillus thermoaerophilus]
MYTNGQRLYDDKHFMDHLDHEVPIQIYLDGKHKDIGFVERVSEHFVRVNNTYYNRSMYWFVSRPGY